MTPPTIYLTTAGAVTAVRRGKAKPETAASVGPGPVYSIMRHPRPEYGEAGAGRVLAFTPPAELLAEAMERRKRDGDASAWAWYEPIIVARWAAHAELHAPGVLQFYTQVAPYNELGRRWDGDRWYVRGPVEGGSTLICACGREQAARGFCHRVTAARMLADAGWFVVLDGVVYERSAA